MNKGVSGPEPSGNTINRRAMLGLSAASLAGSLAARSGKEAAQLADAPLRRRFTNKGVLITGATSGIGRAAALQFAAEGGKVAFCGRRESLGHEVETLIRSKVGKASYIRADVRDESQVSLCRLDRARIRTARCGIQQRENHSGGAVARIHVRDDVMNTDLRGVFLSMKYEIPYMLQNGGGNIVVTSSSNAIATTAKRPTLC